MALIETVSDHNFATAVESLNRRVETLNQQINIMGELPDKVDHLTRAIKESNEVNDNLTTLVNQLILKISDQNDLIERLIRNQTLSN